MSSDNNQTSRAGYTFSYSGLSDTGLVRTRNEDSFVCLPEHNLWVVADGMGGHDGGDFASRTICEQAAKYTGQASLEDSILLLEENILHSNVIIRKRASHLGKQATIGSTITALYLWRDLAFVLWAGDSRLYLLRDGKLERLTEDHSYVEELVRMGKLQADEAEEHPAANVVLNAVGIGEELVIDMEYYPIKHGDMFLLCSDGLYKDLGDRDIEAIINAPDTSLEQMNRALIDAALAKGGNDNTTVVLVRAQAEAANG